MFDAIENLTTLLFNLLLLLLVSIFLLGFTALATIGSYAAYKDMKQNGLLPWTSSSPTCTGTIEKTTEGK